MLFIVSLKVCYSMYHRPRLMSYRAKKCRKYCCDIEPRVLTCNWIYPQLKPGAKRYLDRRKKYNQSLEAHRRLVEPYSQTGPGIASVFPRVPHWTRHPCWRTHPGSETMMTSSNGNIFRATGPLRGEFIGHRWIPLAKASDAELWCFLWPASE